MSAPRTAVCTICAKNYIARARTLMASVATHEPSWDRFVLFVDAIEGYVVEADEDFSVLTDRDLGLPERPHFLFRYELVEANTAVKPWLIALLFRAGYERVVFLDPDTCLYAPLPEVDAAHRTGASIVLTPHVANPLPEGAEPSEAELLRYGTYNLGFLAVENAGSAPAFLRWWQGHLERQGTVDRERGLFVDQKWVDLVPGLFPDVAILRHEGYNVAYWNLAGRRVHAGREETDLRVNEDGLRFMHFSGFDPKTPDVLTQPGMHAPAIRATGPLRALCRAYAEALLESDYEATHAWPYAYATLVDDTPIPRCVRRLALETEAGSLGPDPFARDAAWLCEDVAPDPASGLAYTRTMDALWRDVPALDWLFPAPRDRDRLAYARWFVRHAPEHGVSADLIAPVKASVDRGRRRGLRLFPREPR